MSKLSVAIIIVAYNRPDSLKRLLGSVSKAMYPDGLEPELIISIDNSGSNECFEVASGYRWEWGKKTVIHHSRNLGLKEHILKCGDLSSAYDFIILLEDDLYVSEYYCDYALKAHDFYKDDNKIAGISLYSYCFNETANKHFTPLHNGSDVFFLQLPSSWGQVWTGEQWKKFRVWLEEEYSLEKMHDFLVPENVLGWPDSSWKKLFIFYMIASDLYFVHPRLSLSTNFMDYGTHHVFDENFLQVPLQAAMIDYSFIETDETDIFYDSFCELLPYRFSKCIEQYGSFDFEVDLYGTKPLEKIRKRYVLTGRMSYNSLFQYELALKPHELNVLYDNRGSDIYFARTATIADRTYQLPEQKRNSYYFSIPEFLIRPGKSVESVDKNSRRWVFYIKQTILWRAAKAIKNRMVALMKKIKYKLSG